MFHLIHGIYTTLTEIDEYRILIIGLDNTGKSTFLEAIKRKLIKGYKGMNFECIISTIGLNLGEIVVNNKIRLKFFDLGGQRELRRLWDKYYHEVECIIYVIDSSDRLRMNESKEYFEMLISKHEINIPLLILANKQDVEDCIKIKEIEEKFELSRLMDLRECAIIPAAVLKDFGVQESIDWLNKVIAHENRYPKSQL